MSHFFRDLPENNSYVKKLIYQIQIKFPKVNEATIRRFFAEMKTHGVLMAGGAILHVLTKQEGYVNDFDLYAPLESVRRMVQLLETDFSGLRLPDRYASTYSMSFLRKNGIQKVVSFSNKSQFVRRHYSALFEIPFFEKPVFDLMQLKEGIRPLNVVSNFDLTFCQVWFDGERFYATHPSDVRKKSGTLNEDYVATFASGNVFLKNRVQKYIDKGFNVCIPGKRETNIPIRDIPVVKDDTYYKKWFYRGALRYALSVYPFFNQHDVTASRDPETGVNLFHHRQPLINAWWNRAQDPEAFRQAEDTYTAIQGRIGNVTKPLDGIDDSEIESLEQLVAILNGDREKAYQGIVKFSQNVEENFEEWDEVPHYVPYVDIARDILRDSERFRRTQLRSFTGSQFARSLPNAGLQRTIMEMANVPALRQQAVNIGVQIPPQLNNAAIQAAMNRPPLRPQRGPLQSPNWGNRPAAAAPNAQGPPPNAGRGGAKKMKKTQKQKKRYSGKTRKH